jgi:hypothetical protein
MNGGNFIPPIQMATFDLPLASIYFYFFHRAYWIKFVSFAVGGSF